MDLELLKAKKLYAQGNTAKEIASALNKSQGTIYRWIKDNKEEFEEARRLANLTLDDMEDILDEANKKVLLDIIKDSEKLKDPKIADALIKIANVLEKIGLRSEKKKIKEKVEKVEEVGGVVFIDDIKDEKDK